MNQQRLIGMAFLSEGLDTSAAGQDDTTTAGTSSDVDGVAARALIACDIDGRHYQILRVRGAANPTVTVLDDPPASVRATVIPACLHRILTTACS